MLVPMPNPDGQKFAFRTLGVHAGYAPDPTTGAITPPIHLSTTFERDTDGNFSRGYSYVRDGNPNRAALEACLRELEQGEDCVAFGSGMAAAFSIFQALSPNDHVIIHRDVYYGVRDLLQHTFSRWGLQYTAVDMRDSGEIRRARRDQTKLLWLETPSNPLIEVVAIEPVAALAREMGWVLVCENTFATPALQNPLCLGADLVVHSLTKYICGHSDSMGGAVILKEANEFGDRIREFQVHGGAVLNPFDCWLAQRGLQTLGPRMRVHCENTLMVAEFLVGHKAVAVVHYPGLSNNPGHAAAKKQMRDYGGMLSFEIRGGRAEAFAFISRLEIIARATSLGGTHSLIEHRASIEGPSTRASESLLRLSVGLEDGQDLVRDLEQALAALAS
jgi:cystathionine gamma-synthase